MTTELFECLIASKIFYFLIILIISPLVFHDSIFDGLTYDKLMKDWPCKIALWILFNKKFGENIYIDLEFDETQSEIERNVNNYCKTLPPFLPKNKTQQTGVEKLECNQIWFAGSNFRYCNVKWSQQLLIEISYHLSYRLELLVGGSLTSYLAVGCCIWLRRDHAE